MRRTRKKRVVRKLWYHGLIAANRHAILTGTVLAIDPSAGSRSSLPGWALYEAGKLVKSGTIKVNLDWPLARRLKAISDKVKVLAEGADIVCIEYIPPSFRRPHSGLDSLMKSVGAVMAAVGDRVVIEVPPTVWQKNPGPTWVKGDEADAIGIGHYTVAAASNPNLTEEEDEPNTPVLSGSFKAKARPGRRPAASREVVERLRRLRGEPSGGVGEERDSTDFNAVASRKKRKGRNARAKQPARRTIPRRVSNRTRTKRA